MNRSANTAAIVAAVATTVGMLVALLQWQCPKAPSDGGSREAIATIDAPTTAGTTKNVEGQDQDQGTAEIDPHPASPSEERNDGTGRQASSPRVEAEQTRNPVEQRSNRYVNSTGIGTWPQVLVVDASGKIDVATAGRIAKPLKGRTDLFRQAFVQDGLFDLALAGEASILAELGLSRHRGRILFVKIETRESVSSNLAPDLQRAEVVLISRQVDPTRDFYSVVGSVRRVGAGFSTTVARERALSQAVDQLVTEIQEYPN